MRLVMHSPEEGADLMVSELSHLMSEGRKVIIVAYGLRTLDLLEGAISSERGVTLIPSFSSNLTTPLILLLSMIRRGEACLVDEIFSPYLRAVSSSTKPYEVQRAFLTLLNLIRAFEKQVNATVSMYTSVQGVPEWFLRIFDSVESHLGG